MYIYEGLNCDLGNLIENLLQKTNLNIKMNECGIKKIIILPNISTIKILLILLIMLHESKPGQSNLICIFLYC